MRICCLLLPFDKLKTRNLVLVFLLILTFQSTFAQLNTHFVTTWKTDNPGTSNNTSIIIPTNNLYTYNYDVDWDNDGTFDQLGITGNVTHDFLVAGTYTIRIRGQFPAIQMGGSGESNKLLSVDQWGTQAWKSMFQSFMECHNFRINATDTPDTHLVTNMTATFLDCQVLNDNINNWDVSQVTTMFSLFDGCFVFNQPLNNWDVGRVTDMSQMFIHANAFNQNIDNWDTHSVTRLWNTFFEATSFNQPVNSWDVSHVADMRGIFIRASSFNQPLNNWDTSSATNMTSLFSGASSYNQPLHNWDTSHVTNMNNLFFDASSFNQPINS